MSKKVLNVVNIYFCIPFFFGDQLTYFKKKGYQIHLVCSPSEHLKPFSDSHGCKYKEITILRTFSVLQDLKAVYALYKYIKDNQIDIVCGHTPKAGLLSMLAAFVARVPTRVFFRHGLVYETSSGIKRFILKTCERIASLCSTKVVCVSPYLIERSLKDKLSSKSKMILFNIGSCNGVDANGKFNPDLIDLNKKERLRESLLIPKEAFVIGYSGRLVRDKGLVELVGAFIELYKTNSNVYLLLVGPLEKRDALPNDIVQIIKTNPHIKYTGNINDNIEYYYSLMNLLVLSTHREGLGTCILEASSMGIPVLTTAHTGSRDAIEENVTGQYIDMTVDSIVSKTQNYILHPQLAKQHGMNGRKFVLKNFEQKIIWKEIEEKVYENN